LVLSTTLLVKHLAHLKTADESKTASDSTALAV
jgi:hypothetical protein